MEVDGIQSWNNPPDYGKYTNLKEFVTSAREFEASHSESAINSMNRYLGLIASSCDLSIFSPGRSEVCAFFSSLWRVMSDGRGPHWSGVAVLSRAVIEPSARYALTHTYKFLPILSRLLTSTISNEKQIKLLSVMQEISYGIKISWQESYLPSLMKQLCDWITRSVPDIQLPTIGYKSLTVLVNLCYGNLPAIYALLRTVDTRDFVVHLVNLKDNGYVGVEVCRLLLCLSRATRGAAAARQHDIYGYLDCTMRTFLKAILLKDSSKLLHAHKFLNDLCADHNLRGFVLTYPQFSQTLTDSVQNLENLCKIDADDTKEPEQLIECLRYSLKFVTAIIGLDLYSLRCHHSHLVRFCITASRVCLPEALELFEAIIKQYRDEGRLTQDLLPVISDGLPGLLVPPALEPGKDGLHWLQVVGALCELTETQERVLIEVTPEIFETTLYSVLQYTSQNGAVGSDVALQAATVGCHVGLTLAPQSQPWTAALHRLFAHRLIRRLLCTGLTSGDGKRRRQILQLIKHHYFPLDQMNQVFGESLYSESQASDECLVASGAGEGESVWVAHLSPAQERAVDALVDKLNEALRSGKISDIATSSVMELYGYKMTCLEQRLHSHTVALQGASEHMATLQHSLAMIQATNSSQQDVLYATQMQNERHKQTIDDLHKQLEDAEKSLRGFRAKLTTERTEKENLKENMQKELKAQLENFDRFVKEHKRESEEKLKAAEEENKQLHKKIEQQVVKHNELAEALIKFEERVKQRDKKLQDASALEVALRKDLEQRDTMIKQLEKTVAERENRLFQVTGQLEEMKRVQEIVANLMAKSASGST
ncbi:hypothetical protein ACJJTC_015852 [Scirpophaga incertulas]